MTQVLPSYNIFQNIDFSSPIHETNNFQEFNKDILVLGQQTQGNSTLDQKGLLQQPLSSAYKEDLFPDEVIQMEWKNIQQVGVGLTNIANTCFMNSVLQILAHTPPLSEVLLKENLVQKYNLRGYFVGIFKDLVRPLFSQHFPLTPRAFALSLQKLKTSFTLGEQEDSHEYLRVLLDAMHEAQLAPYKPKPPKHLEDSTFIYKIFGGKVISQVKCIGVNYVSKREDTFFDLPLDIYRANSIYDALNDFIKEETLDGDNKYRCPTNNQLVRALRQTKIKQAPRILTIVLKRFAFWGFSRKINRYVSFPPYLDISPYIDQQCSNSSDTTTQATEQHQSIKPQKQQQKYMYELYALLVHQGMYSGSGHYVAYVKGPNGVWHEMNDAFVRMVSEQTVLKQQAYMLLYKQSYQQCQDQPLKQQQQNQDSFRQSKRPLDQESTINLQSHKKQQKTDKENDVGVSQQEVKELMKTHIASDTQQKNSIENDQSNRIKLNNLQLERVIQHLPISPGRKLIEKCSLQLQNNLQDAQKIINGIQIDAGDNSNLISREESEQNMQTPNLQDQDFSLKRRSYSLGASDKAHRKHFLKRYSTQIEELHKAQSINQDESLKLQSKLAKGGTPRKQKSEMITQHMSWMRYQEILHENVTKNSNKQEHSVKKPWTNLKFDKSCGVTDFKQVQVQKNLKSPSILHNKSLDTQQDLNNSKEVLSEMQIIQKDFDERMQNESSQSRLSNKNINNRVHQNTNHDNVRQGIAKSDKISLANYSQDTNNTNGQIKTANPQEPKGQNARNEQEQQTGSDNIKQSNNLKESLQFLNDTLKGSIEDAPINKQHDQNQLQLRPRQPKQQIVASGSEVFSQMLIKGEKQTTAKPWGDDQQQQVNAQFLGTLERQTEVQHKPRYIYDIWDETLDQGKQKKIRRRNQQHQQF